MFYAEILLLSFFVSLQLTTSCTFFKDIFLFVFLSIQNNLNDRKHKNIANVICKTLLTGFTTKKFHKIKLQIGMTNLYFIIQIPLSSHMCVTPCITHTAQEEC